MKIFKYLKNVWIVYLDWSRTLIISAMLYKRPCAFLFNMAPTNVGEPFLSVAPLGSWLTELSSIHKLWWWFIIIVASSARPAGWWAICTRPPLSHRVTWGGTVGLNSEGTVPRRRPTPSIPRNGRMRTARRRSRGTLPRWRSTARSSVSLLILRYLSVWFFCAVNCRYLLVCVVFFVL